MRAWKQRFIAAGALSLALLASGCGLTSKLPGMGWIDRTASNPFDRSEMDVPVPSTAATPRSIDAKANATAASDASARAVDSDYPTTNYGPGVSDPVNTLGATGADKYRYPSDRMAAADDGLSRPQRGFYGQSDDSVDRGISSAPDSAYGKLETPADVAYDSTENYDTSSYDAESYNADYADETYDTEPYTGQPYADSYEDNPSDSYADSEAAYSYTAEQHSANADSNQSSPTRQHAAEDYPAGDYSFGGDSNTADQNDYAHRDRMDVPAYPESEPSLSDRPAYDGPVTNPHFQRPGSQADIPHGAASDTASGRPPSREFGANSADGTTFDNLPMTKPDEGPPQTARFGDPNSVRSGSFNDNPYVATDEVYGDYRPLDESGPPAREPFETEVTPTMPTAEPREPIRQAAPWRPGSTGDVNSQTSHRPIISRKALTMSVGYSRYPIMR